MSYLEEFKKVIKNRNYNKFFQLWEEYCTNDRVDSEELIEILKEIKRSDFSSPLGKYAETAIPIWEMIEDEVSSYEVLKHLIDIQTTNPPHLADEAEKALKKKYGDHPKFNEGIRLTGLRNKQHYEGAISNFDLFVHFEKGNFVYHTGGWGAGEIMEVSFLREHLDIEFENIAGIKHFSFKNAFKNLIPIEQDNFMARRFGNPDKFEDEARKDPVWAVKLLLRDLGPKNAAEIKDEMCEWVIPEKDWTKWWQGARARIKKDTMIETPVTIRDPFILLLKELPHEDRLLKEIREKTNINEIILTSYNFIRDLPVVMKKEEVREEIKNKILSLLEHPELEKRQELQILIFLETIFGHKVEGKNLENVIVEWKRLERIIDSFEILSFKKRALILIRKYREDWVEIFMNLFTAPQQNPIRDYLLKELNEDPIGQKVLIEKLENLLLQPVKYPDLLVWYFQKIVKESESNFPFANKKGQCQFFETFLILMQKIETKKEYRDLVKKMYNMLSGKRYQLVRQLIKDTSIEFIKEYLLLVSKCHTFNDHDLKNLRSLGEVVHPSISKKKKDRKRELTEGNIIWTTADSYRKTQERAQRIGTIEIVENAREVEAARELGDLRENAEYKFACEKRSRLQGELKMLTEQMNRARIITEQDILTDEVGVGSVIEVETPSEKKEKYTILGPWDAKPEDGILSFQSEFAQAMIGNKPGESFKFRDEEYKILNLKSFLEK